jgi:hypothetical protein
MLNSVRNFVDDTCIFAKTDLDSWSRPEQYQVSRGEKEHRKRSERRLVVLKGGGMVASYFRLLIQNSPSKYIVVYYIGPCRNVGSLRERPLDR